MTKVKKGFTLAEILITLAIIGVVAAMTIPTLISKINTIVTENQVKVFNAKLIKGLNLTKTAGDLNDTYETTYDFLVNGLGKNLKMAKICDNSHIRDCIPYDKIKYEKSNGTDTELYVRDIKTANQLHLKAPFMEPAAFMLADGTPAIVSYNKQCIDDPDKADTAINSCLAGIYDFNGSRKPNKYGDISANNSSDLRGFNGATLAPVCIQSEESKVCLLTTALGGSNEVYDITMFNAIKENYPDYSYPKMWGYINDRWQLAQDYCEKAIGGKFPTTDDLTIIARVLYDRPTLTDALSSHQIMKNKTSIYAALGLDENLEDFTIWASGTNSIEYGYTREFYSGTSSSRGYRSNARIYTICVE